MTLQTIKVDIDDDEFGQRVFDVDIDFVTDERILHFADGAVVNINDMKTYDDSETEIEKYHVLQSIAINLTLNHQFRKELDEGRKYAKEHGIELSKWAREAEEYEAKEQKRMDAECDAYNARMKETGSVPLGGDIEATVIHKK